MPVRKSAKAVSFKGTYRKSSEGGMHFVTVPAEVRSEFLTKGPARVVATIGTLEPFQCGLMPNSNGEGYIIVNKARQKRLGLEPGA